MTKPRVIGLDLSLTATGIAYADGTTATIKTDQKDGDRRLLHIEGVVLWAAGECQGPMGADMWPDLAVIEDLPINAKGAGITGMVQGVVRALLIRAGVPYVLIPPGTLKKYATGNGGATKADMRVALLQRTGVDLRDDNQVDAAWLRFMGLDWLGHPVVNLPKAQREALAKVSWPSLAAVSLSEEERA